MINRSEADIHQVGFVWGGTAHPDWPHHKNFLQWMADHIGPEDMVVTDVVQHNILHTFF